MYRLGVSETEVEVLFENDMSEEIEKNYVAPLKVFTKTVEEFDFKALVGRGRDTRFDIDDDDSDEDEQPAPAPKKRRVIEESDED